MIGLDTSHVIAFTRYLNGPENTTDLRVVAGYPGGSPDLPASADRVGKFTQELRDEFGIEIVESIEDLCGKVDGVLLESVDGRPHLEQARPVIAARKPLFVDKPLASNLADAIEILRLAQENNVPCWSGSAYRFAEGVAGARDNEALGKVVGCDTFGSSSWTDFHPDLYLYGIHAVEALFTVMGTGCETVRRVKTGATDLAVGTWRDGRIGTFRDLCGGKAGTMAYIYGTKGMVAGKPLGYLALLEQIVKCFQTGQPPVPAEETIEVMAFMSAADESKVRDGAPVSLQALIAEAKAK
ncbi:MAG: Gfo/Idh/MocA family oxidoreductase [Armatimonadetes bacterium]|nr:Gfo/Idh/MocA family oxidoreductase [Armatimonadota bacterium]